MKIKLFTLGLGLAILSMLGLTFAQDCSVEGQTRNLGICSCPSNQIEVNKKCELCSLPNVCCGVKLNTNVPFIGNCIELGQANGTTDKITEANAFPTLIAGLTKLLMTVILIVCFLVVIVAGVLWTTGDSKKGKELIKGVAIALALLGASGVILRLVNPNFFG